MPSHLKHSSSEIKSEGYCMVFPSIYLKLFVVFLSCICYEKSHTSMLIRWESTFTKSEDLFFFFLNPEAWEILWERKSLHLPFWERGTVESQVWKLVSHWVSGEEKISC